MLWFNTHTEGWVGSWCTGWLAGGLLAVDDPHGHLYDGVDRETRQNSALTADFENHVNRIRPGRENKNK